MSLSGILVICLLSLSSVPAQAADAAESPSENVIHSLLAALPGSWDGRAIETPVGPVDYAIVFHQCDGELIAGVAELSVSDHYWQFGRSDGKLGLTFLSTFRGNQQPTRLVVSGVEENTIRFHAPGLASLTLALSLAEPHVNLRVFHDHEPHVHIRLTRSGRQVTEHEHAGSRVKSCRSL